MKQAPWLLSACFARSKYVRRVRLGVVERPRAGVGSLIVGLVVVAVAVIVFVDGTVGLRVAYAVLAFLELLAFS